MAQTLLSKAADKLIEMEFAYESDAADSFLVIKYNAEILEYQALMLAKNRIGFVIPVEVLRKEGLLLFYYNITSLISLSFYLSRRELSREQFLMLLLRIATAVNDCTGYLLDDSNFIFSAEHIYVSPDTLEPSLVYIPAQLESEALPGFPDFISDLLLKHINTAGFESGNLVQRLLAAVKAEAFNIKGLIALLSELIYGDCDSNRSHADDDRLNYLSSRANNHDNLKSKKAAFKEPDGNACAYELRKSSASKELNGKVASSIKKCRNRESHKGIFKPGSVLRIAVPAVLTQFIVGVGIYLCRNFLDNIGSNRTATYAAVAMIVLAIDVLLLKKLSDAGFISFKPGEGNKIVPDISLKDKDIIMHESEIPSSANDSKVTHSAYVSALPSAYESKVPSPVYVSKATPTEAGETAFVNMSRTSGKTELLVNLKKDGRILKRIGNHGECGDILIDKDDFIIGRLEGHVDHVILNNAVGKLHTQLILKEGTCYVKDLNTVNGTFINGERLESNKEFGIKNNDTLRIANIEFAFTDS